MNKLFLNKTKFAQIAIFEFSLIALLFSGLALYLTVDTQPNSNDYYSYNIQSYLSALTKTDNFREKVILENLSSQTLTQDWTQILLNIEKSYTNFELKLSNSTDSKFIKSCNSTNGKFMTKSFISSYNNTIFDTKTIIFGVCY